MSNFDSSKQHQAPVRQNQMMPENTQSGPSLAPPAFQLKSSESPAQLVEDVSIQKGTLTSTGEGSDAQTKHVHWPDTSASGVTLGKGYDIGSRGEQQVIDELTAAGMSITQATKISKGKGLKGAAAGTWVTNNKADVGIISKEVQTSLLATMLESYTGKAKRVATNTTATKDGNGYYTNARGREINDGVEAGTYVLTTAQWDALHPAMVELLTDLKYQGGYYLYDRVAKVNKALTENDGDQLAQFKAVIGIFEADAAGGKSYMDRYGKKIGEGTGNKETFFDQSKADLEKASTRRNRIRLAYLKKIVGILESGKTVSITDGTDDATTADTAAPETVPAPDLDSPAPKKKTPKPKASATGASYTVLPGEGLLVIAKKHGITIDALKAANAGKLQKWGRVEGFNSGASIVIPGKGTKPAKPAPTPSGGKTYKVLSGEGLLAIANKHGITVDALKAANVDKLKKWGKVEGFNSGENITIPSGGSSSPTPVDEKANSETTNQPNAPQVVPEVVPETSTPAPVAASPESTTGTATDYLTAAMTGSVGVGGDNKAKDVKIVQQNLVHLGFLSSSAEVTTVAAMGDTDVVTQANLTATIAAIWLYQKRGMGSGGDGKIDAGGGTFKNMKARLELMTEYSSHVISKTDPIAAVMTNSEWISQFKDGANVKSNGTSVNMSITGDGRGLLDSEKAYSTKSNYVCCWDAARAMVMQKSGDISGIKTSSLQAMVQNDGVNRELGDQATIGVKYIDKNLADGKPTMIGVDDGRTKVYNYDGTTEHYIVIMEKVIKDEKVYYRFFDPGTAHGASKGYSSDNLLLLGDGSQLTGSKPGSSRTYTMAHVRLDGDD